MSELHKARRMWTAVAGKRFDVPEVAEWVADVAKRVLEADKLKGSKREDELRAAVDLRGAAEDMPGDSSGLVSHYENVILALSILRHEREGHRPGINTAVGARNFVAGLVGWSGKTTAAINKAIDRAISAEIDDPAVRAATYRALCRRQPVNRSDTG